MRADASLIGRQLGSCRIEAYVGAGAMATVWRASSPTLGSPVAVKVLDPEEATDHQLVQRFMREARTAASIHHPNIVRVVDMGEADGLSYLVMEFVEGQSLRDMLNAGPLEPLDAVTYAIGVARALEAVWQQHVVHRDIKPSNVLITHNGLVKLCDMGLAKMIRPGDGQDVEKLTAAGVAVGTINYMSPEQLRAAPELDTRTDIYALGATLYELIEGETPFFGSTFEVINQHLMGERPSPSRAAAWPRLQSLVVQMMSVDPAQRPQTPTELIERLEQVRREIMASQVAFAETIAGGDINVADLGLGELGIASTRLPDSMEVASTLAGPELAGAGVGAGEHEAVTGTALMAPEDHAPAGSGTAVMDLEHTKHSAQPPADDWGAAAGEDAEAQHPALRQTAAAAPKKRSKLGLALAAVVVLGLAAGGGWYLTRDGSPSAPALPGDKEVAQLSGKHDEKSGGGVRIRYDFSDPKQLADWRPRGPTTKVELRDGAMVVSFDSSAGKDELALVLLRTPIAVERLRFSARVLDGDHINWYINARWLPNEQVSWCPKHGYGGVHRHDGFLQCALGHVPERGSGAPVYPGKTYPVDVSVGDAHIDWRVGDVRRRIVAERYSKPDRYVALGCWGCQLALDDVIVEGRVK